MDNRNIADYPQTLFPYAYNILGQVEEARDVVQEVLTRHFASPPAREVINLKNYLIKSVINLAINTKSRQNKTLRQGEVWLPEPVATDDAADRSLNLNEVLSYSLMVLMEKLNPTERAVFILRESFDYSHEEISEVLSITEEYSRKLLSRAKERLFKPAPKPGAVQDEHQQAVVERFIHAIRQRDTAQLESYLTADIHFYADGGGKAPMVKGTCIGMVDVAALEILVYHKFLARCQMVYTVVNHQPALLFYKEERLITCQVFDISPETGLIMQLNVMLDPAKLKNLAAARE
jgi:RNA polymerase sigma factor (sigma-70 family)